jgi:NADH-quinone oxidoreductase subunit E
MSKHNGNGKVKTEPQGSALYEVLKGIDFERRELVGKRKGTGLFDLVKEKSGDYRCYACTLCERTCPVDCIEIDYCPEFPELPFDREAERAAALEAQPKIDTKQLSAVIARIREGSGLVEALHTTQEVYGWLPRLALEEIASETQLPFSRVFGVASFYAQFRLLPVGKHVISVCMGTACHVAGAPLVAEAFAQALDIEIGATTPDMLFTLQTVNCIGACALAPAVRIGEEDTYAQARHHDPQEGGLRWRPVPRPAPPARLASARRSRLPSSPSWPAVAKTP